MTRKFFTDENFTINIGSDEIKGEKLTSLDQALVNFCQSKKIDLTIFHALLVRVVKLQLPFSRFYAALPYITGSEVGSLLKQEDTEFKIGISILKYRACCDSLKESFKFTGLIKNIQSLEKENINVISIGSGLSEEIGELLSIGKKMEYFGVEISKVNIEYAKSIYIAINKIFPKNAKLFNLDARNLLSHKDFLNIKFDVIILRNPFLITSSPEFKAFEEIITKIIPNIAAEKCLLYISTYYPQEMDIALKLFKITKEFEYSPQDPFIPLSDKIAICTNYSPSHTEEKKRTSSSSFPYEENLIRAKLAYKNGDYKTAVAEIEAFLKPNVTPDTRFPFNAYWILGYSKFKIGQGKRDIQILLLAKEYMELAIKKAQNNKADYQKHLNACNNLLQELSDRSDSTDFPDSKKDTESSITTSVEQTGQNFCAKITDCLSAIFLGNIPKTTQFDLMSGLSSPSKRASMNNKSE